MELKEILNQHVKAFEEKLAGNTDAIQILQQLVFDIEQKMARGDNFGGRGHASEPTWGQTFTHSKADELAGMGRSDRVSVSFKAAITSATTNAAGSAGDLIVPQREAVIGLPQQRLTIRNLLNVTPVSSGSVERPRLIARPTGAGMVAEGAKKPESNMQWGMETVPMRVIAHWIKASRQILDDVPQLQSMVDVELRYGLAVKEEEQLLFGDGTGQNLNGMMENAVSFDPAIIDVTAPTLIDKIGMAILQGSLTDIAPDGIVLHPSDWWRIRLTKDADGKYIMGDPGMVVQPSLFGLPVVPTKAQEVDNFLVGAFNAQTLYDRWEARVEAGFENDDFTRNMVTLLAEERVGFDPEHPTSLIKGTFTDVTP